MSFPSILHAAPLCEAVPISRRGLMGAGVSFFAWQYAMRQASAAGSRDPRFLTVILRGALDGLGTLAPVGDPDYAALHGAIALRTDGDIPAIALDGFFALHPAMPNLARLYKGKQASLVHAVASPYRERSHFDGQDVLESGLPGVGRAETGWLNRAILALPKGERIRTQGALGVGISTPLILCGAAPVLGWAPQRIAEAPEDVAQRLLELYAARDPALGKALSAGLEVDRLARGDQKQPGGGNPNDMVKAAAGAARLMMKEDGPRIAALSFDGWDTHVNQGGSKGRLATVLAGLDAALGAIETEFQAAWTDTVILVVTEFGRTARVNGTEGSDHGTATIAMLLGGAVKGGRIISDWPGLKLGQLHEGRDLKPTTDLRAVMKGVLAGHLGLSPSLLGDVIFPGSGMIKPLDGLIL